MAEFAVLVALTWLIGLGVSPYRSLHSPRLAEFPVDEAAWSIEVTGDSRPETGIGETVSFGGGVQGETRSFFTPSLERPAGEVRVHISGRVSEGLAVEASTGFSAIVVRFERADGTRVKRRYAHVAPSRERDSRVSAVLVWPPEAARVRVGFVGRGRGPTLTVRDGRVELVRANPVYSWTVAATLLVGLLWGARAIRTHFRTAPLPLARLPVVLSASLVGAMLTGVLLPEAVLAPLFEVPQRIASALPIGSFVFDPGTASLWVSKSAHALGFFALTALLLRSNGPSRRDRVTALCFVALLAVGTEGLQLHLAGRSAAFSDVLIDGAGIVAALVVHVVLARRSRGVRPRSNTARSV